jgi:hypothetical protein
MMKMNGEFTYRLMSENKGAYRDLVIVELLCTGNIFILNQMSHSKGVEDKSILATSLEKKREANILVQ